MEENMKYDFYLAGGMRGYKDLNKAMFTLASRLLREHGFTIWSPAEVVDNSNMKFAECMILDLNTIIRDCKGIALLPGWYKSLGANTEAFVAFATGKISVEIIMNKNGSGFGILPVDLSKYILPYGNGKECQFNPHKCDLDSFIEKE